MFQQLEALDLHLFNQLESPIRHQSQESDQSTYVIKETFSGILL